jgi:dTDP-4-dehydrorhamnose 3,5-epimerase-like enzyme
VNVLIGGIYIRDITKNVDERGFFSELMRED